MWLVVYVAASCRSSNFSTLVLPRQPTILRQNPPRPPPTRSSLSLDNQHHPVLSYPPISSNTEHCSSPSCSILSFWFSDLLIPTYFSLALQHSPPPPSFCNSISHHLPLRFYIVVLAFASTPSSPNALVGPVKLTFPPLPSIANHSPPSSFFLAALSCAPLLPSPFCS